MMTKMKGQVASITRTLATPNTSNLENADDGTGGGGSMRKKGGRDRWVRVGILRDSFSVVSSSINRLLLFLFHASRLLCCVCAMLLCMYPPL